MERRGRRTLSGIPSRVAPRPVEDPSWKSETPALGPVLRLQGHTSTGLGAGLIREAENEGRSERRRVAARRLDDNEDLWPLAPVPEAPAPSLAWPTRRGHQVWRGKPLSGANMKYREI